MKKVLLFPAIALCFAASTFDSLSASHLPSSGFYRVRQERGVWWFVAPDGRRMFSLACDVVDQGQTREKYREAKPEYASFRYYGSGAEWGRDTLRRLRAWGFNSLGAWADEKTLETCGELMLPYTKGLWLGSNAGVPWLDLFGKKAEGTIDRVARETVVPRKDDPLLIGWYTDNELGWWGDTVFDYHAGHGIGTATRRVFLQALRDHYGGSFQRLRRDFLTGRAKSFRDLEKPCKLLLRSGGRGRDIIEKFVGILAARYYKLCHDAIRRYDRNHLILGDRYISWYPKVVAKAVGDYADVVSTNYNIDWNDGASARFHLDTLYRITKKPILITEFYFCANENRSGNKNPNGGFTTVQTQAQRAAGLRRALRELISLPFLVGMHWFQYYDEPTFGRPDGENFNMGLVDIHNVPYDGVVDAFREAGNRLDDWHGASLSVHAARPDARSGVPRALGDPLAGMNGWPKARALVPPATPEPFSDLYLCWDEKALYVAAHAAGFADRTIYPGRTANSAGRFELRLKLPGRASPLRIEFGPGSGPSSLGAKLRLWQQQRSTRFTVVAAIPAVLFGMPRIQAGDRIPLEAELVAQGGHDRDRWRGAFALLRSGSPSPSSLE